MFATVFKQVSITIAEQGFSRKWFCNKAYSFFAFPLSVLSMVYFDYRNKKGADAKKVYVKLKVILSVLLCVCILKMNLRSTE